MHVRYEESREFLFLDNMHSTDRSQGSSIQPVFVRKSVYLAYFGRRVFGDFEPSGRRTTPVGDSSIGLACY